MCMTTSFLTYLLRSEHDTNKFAAFTFYLSFLKIIRYEALWNIKKLPINRVGLVKNCLGERGAIRGAAEELIE